jgi:hypothetical protein
MGKQILTALLAFELSSFAQENMALLMPVKFLFKDFFGFF